MSVSQPHDSVTVWISKAAAWLFAYGGAWFATWGLPDVEILARILSALVLSACGVLHAWLAWRKRDKP